MKKILLICFLFQQISFAGCNFKSDIKKLESGSYLYTRNCHIQVGTNIADLGYKNIIIKKQDEEIKNLNSKTNNLKQINNDLNRVVELKDLAISKEQEISQMWMQEAENQNARLNKQQKLAKINRTIYFSAGLVAAIAGFFVFKQISK